MRFRVQSFQRIMLTTRTSTGAIPLPKFFSGSFLHGLVWTTVLASSMAARAQSPISQVKFEAESGMIGSDFAVSNSTSPAYITITTDFAGNYPSNAARVATYTVTFPTAGTYQLYAHVRVGSGGFNDDSLFYGNGFGTEDPTNPADWILVNGLGGVGFSNPTNIVTGGGTLGSGVWKWINLSLFAPGPSFTVDDANLVQTFQIGARESGLDMDAFVFGLSGVTFTVSNSGCRCGRKISHCRCHDDKLERCAPTNRWVWWRSGFSGCGIGPDERRQYEHVVWHQ